MLRLWSWQYICWDWIKRVYYGGYWRQTEDLDWKEFIWKQLVSQITISVMFLLHSSKDNLENMYLRLLCKRMFKWDLLWNCKFHVLYLTCGQYSRDAKVRLRSESGFLVFNHMTLRGLFNLGVEEWRSCGWYMFPLKGIIPISQVFCKASVNILCKVPDTVIGTLSMLSVNESYYI